MEEEAKKKKIVVCVFWLKCDLESEGLRGLAVF